MDSNELSLINRLSPPAEIAPPVLLAVFDLNEEWLMSELSALAPIAPPLVALLYSKEQLSTVILLPAVKTAPPTPPASL